MQSVQHIFRMGLDGLLLSPKAYRDQRDSPDGLIRGFALVTLVGLLVGVASLIGNLGEYVAQPSPAATFEAVHDGLHAMPWFTQRSEIDSQFPARFDQTFEQITQIILIASGGGLIGSLTGVLTTPLQMLVGWLIFSTVAHLMARALGGQANFSQTLACTALAAGVNILGVVQVFPFAQVAGTVLLSLVASYVAIREAHGLAPWRSFWATVLGPVILAIIMIGLGCIVLFIGFGVIGSTLQGGI